MAVHRGDEDDEDSFPHITGGFEVEGKLAHLTQ